MDLNNQSEAQNKDQEIFIEAYDRHLDQIFRFIYFKVGNSEEAQDLASATFLKVWHHIRQNGAEPKTLKALAYKIARNTVIDYYRKNNSRATVSLEDGMNIPDGRQDILTLSEISFESVLVEKNLLKLKDEYREAIILRYVDELSISEVAEILDKTKTNTRVLLFRALRALREVMKSHNA